MWRFSGAVNRVSKVVPTALRRADNSGVGMGGSGVIGIAASKVSFLARWNCIQVFTDDLAAAKFRGQLFDYVGRQPDFIAYAKNAKSVSIPSMDVTDGTLPSRWLPNPDIEDIDPKTVVAAVPVSKFDILPGVDGIKQLVDGGFLERLEGEGHRIYHIGPADTVPPTARPTPGGVPFDTQGLYRIVKTFAHFPIGLSGGMEPKFLLAKGVRLPDGATGQACVIDEDTGKILNKGDPAVCR